MATTPYAVQRYKEDTDYFFRTLRPSMTRASEECGDHALVVEKKGDYLIAYADSTKLVSVPISSSSTGFYDAVKALQAMIQMKHLPKFYPANRYK